jgi:hypothetical protein
MDLAESGSIGRSLLKREAPKFPVDFAQPTRARGHLVQDLGYDKLIYNQRAYLGSGLF